jgi:hypothetical protein
MKAIKIIWSIIAFIWLCIVSLSLTVDMTNARSAMQASQLYDGASTAILGIIAITMLIHLFDEPSKECLKRLEQRLTSIDEQAKYATEMLNRIERRINPVAPEQAVTLSQPMPIKQPTGKSSEHICPLCHSPMVLRTVAKGEHQGKQFYVCTRYPYCRGVLPA